MSRMLMFKIALEPNEISIVMSIFIKQNDMSCQNHRFLQILASHVLLTKENGHEVQYWEAVHKIMLFYANLIHLSGPH